jgi:hypothetical protein
MADLINREFLDTDPVDCVEEEIKVASEGRRALSRYGLAEIVSERTGMPMDQAQLLVDAYCEEHATYIPAYLGREFGLFWPKVLAFLFALVGIGVFWYGNTLRHAKKPAWLWFAIGTAVFGFAVFQWVRSLESYQRRAAAKQKEKDSRLRDKYAKPR